MGCLASQEHRILSLCGIGIKTRRFLSSWHHIKTTTCSSGEDRFHITQNPGLKVRIGLSTSSVLMATLIRGHPLKEASPLPILHDVGRILGAQPRKRPTRSHHTNTSLVEWPHVPVRQMEQLVAWVVQTVARKSLGLCR